jgi:cytochrome c oxidase subunit 1
VERKREDEKKRPVERLEPPPSAADLDRERRGLQEAWRLPRGIVGWFMAVDHKTIGIRYLVSAFSFFILAGLLAALVRLQLAVPGNTFLGPDLYNQIFTTHGVAMMFLFAVPVMEGIGVYLIPLMVGTRNIAFPRLNAYSYYIFVFGGLLVFGSLLVNTGADSGWFSYVPISGPAYGAGKRSDIFNQMINFTEIAALGAAVAMATTIFKLRAPGMTLNRLPIFVWAMLVTALMVIFAMPAVVLSSLYQLLDRLVGTHFYNPAEGGDVILYQHLFWFFGHPEVYIIFLPAVGMVSAIITTATRRRTFGYLALVLSLFTTAFLAFSVWVHHMFATGLPQLGLNFFTAASLVIVIPAGTQIFCWIAALWRGGFRIQSPMLYVLGFMMTFVVGGLSGATLASVPFNQQVTDTYYVVAHFHYVLVGGAVFPLIAGIHHWYPKMTGRLLSERLATWSFWVLFVGFNVTFFPMHVLGLRGMPRRVYTYPADMGWNTLNLVSSLGALFLASGGALLVFNVVRSLRKGELAGDDPWAADSLEWATTSPPPVYNFLEIPVVEGRHALWERSAEAPVVTGVRSDVREVVVTDVMDAHPVHKMEMPEPSIWPFLAAVATAGLMIGSMFTPWSVVWGSIPLGITGLGWFWPKKKDREMQKESASPDAPAPVMPEAPA